MQNYTWSHMRSTFIELLSNPQASIADPSLRNNTGSQHRGSRTFNVIVEELGECEGVSGYWVEDDLSGYEGFLEQFDDTFWIFNEDEHSWVVRRFRGRRFQRGRRRKGKGKGKGQAGRRRFRPKGKGKGKGKRRACCTSLCVENHH